MDDHLLLISGKERVNKAGLRLFFLKSPTSVTSIWEVKFWRGGVPSFPEQCTSSLRLNYLFKQCHLCWSLPYFWEYGISVHTRSKVLMWPILNKTSEQSVSDELPGRQYLTHVIVIAEGLKHVYKTLLREEF